MTQKSWFLKMVHTNNITHILQLSEFLQSVVHFTDKPQELPREQIKILQVLGIGEFGPIHDAEVQLNVNVKSRSLIKV